MIWEQITKLLAGRHARPNVFARQRIVHPSKPVWWVREKDPVTGKWSATPYYGRRVYRRGK